MQRKFDAFADVERRLIEMLNAPREDVMGLTKTEKNRLRKASQRKHHPLAIAAPDKTRIRLSCLPFSGPVEVFEFEYYTPFKDEAERRALAAVRETGKKFRNIVVLDKCEV